MLISFIIERFVCYVPKLKYKHFKDISKRHVNRLVKKETEQNLPSTSRSNENQCGSDEEICSIENSNQCGSEIPGEISQLEQLCSFSDYEDISDVHNSSVEDGNENGSDSSENSVSFINDDIHENVSNNILNIKIAQS